MLWVALLCYVALSPIVCVLIGRAIRVREVERPAVQPVQETAAEPVPVPASPARTVDDRPKIPA